MRSAITDRKRKRTRDDRESEFTTGKKYAALDRGIATVGTTEGRGKNSLRVRWAFSGGENLCPKKLKKRVWKRNENRKT